MSRKIHPEGHPPRVAPPAPSTCVSQSEANRVVRGSPRLGVNVDHIATVRQARRGFRPDPVEAALICERAGAGSIVCHLREDRRHIQDEDVRRLKVSIQTRLNLEMSTAAEIVSVALRIHPDQVTLVPERRQELTTEGGLDVLKLSKRLRNVIARFKRQGIEVSLFIDPTLVQVRAARDTGATSIELHTGRYAAAQVRHVKAREFSALVTAARTAKNLGLAVAAGHGLEYDNVAEIAGIAEVEELNIGFSIVSRALTVGLESAVSEMAGLLAGSRRQPVRSHALQTA